MKLFSNYTPIDIEMLWQSMELNGQIPFSEICPIEHVIVKRNRKPFRRLPEQELCSRWEANHDLISAWEPLEPTARAKVINGLYFHVFDKDGYRMCSQKTVSGHRCSVSEHITGLLCKDVILGISYDETPLSPQTPETVACTYLANVQGSDYDGMAFPIHDKREQLAGFVGIGNLSGTIPEELIYFGYMGAALLQHKYITILENKEYVRTILNGISDYAIVLNKDNYIVNANDKLITLLNIDANSFVGGLPTAHIQLYGAHKGRDGFDSTLNDSFHFLAADNQVVPFRVVKRHVLQNPVGDKELLIFLERKEHSVYAPALKLSPFHEILGESDAIRTVIGLAARVAKTSANVLIEGETGVGKELIAQAIHQESGRTGPFIPINCGALSRELLQSELFGYEDGAFTGARKGGKAGLFERANRGTILLDEIADMPVDMQVSLLRLLQDRAVTRVGGHQSIKIDVRVIAATNKSLAEEVRRGNFRADLYYRLNVFYIKIPALHHRKEDIPFLAAGILKKLCYHYGMEVPEMSQPVMAILMKYAWPGNVREMTNVIESALITAQGNRIEGKDLPAYLNQGPKPLACEKGTLKDMEQTVILDALKKYDGNLSVVAKSLGISRPTLYRKMDELSIERGTALGR